jgi:hypothetical protein
MTRHVPILLLSLLCASPAAAAKAKREFIFVRVPLVASAVAPAEMAERTVATGEPFLVQRLTAVRSVTLQADAAVKLGVSTARLPKGSRLFFARGWKGQTFYCGGYSPGGLSWTMGDYKVQWLCLEDADADQVFERAWETPLNRGAYLPAFDMVMGINGGGAVSLSYTADAEDARAYYETAIVHEDSFNIYSLLFLYQKVRREGETRWNDIASISRGVRGGYVTIAGNALPGDVNLAGARFTVVSKDKGGLRIRPKSVTIGERAMGVSSTPRR